MLPSGSVIVTDRGVLENILADGTIEKNRIQYFNGTITPGFINAHCHTELSHLKGRISKKTGLPGFGKQIISIRSTFSAEEISEHLHKADKEMREEGIVACGDICNTSDSLKMKESSPIHYHSFIELLGLHPSRATEAMKTGKHLLEQFKNAGLSASLAPHAPYSTSLELISEIADLNTQLDVPSSIHNQESKEETKFFMGDRSGFHDLYEFLKADLAWFKAPGKSSLLWYFSTLKKQQTILVHNTYSSAQDIKNAMRENIFWCFCPNANLYIENSLPDYGLFDEVKNNVCLGTDSLASNSSLSMISEANVLLNSSTFSELEVLRFMTSQGAKALKLENNLGKIKIGKHAGLNLIEIKDKKLHFKKRIL